MSETYAQAAARLMADMDRRKKKAQVLRLPVTPGGRELLRNAHFLCSVWTPPPPGEADISTVDWDKLNVEIDEEFARQDAQSQDYYDWCVKNGRGAPW
jgi:hypothetical protein